MAKITTQQLCKTIKSWDGSNLPALSLKNPCITINHFTIPAGEELPLHKHPIINTGYILQGQITVYKEDGTTIELTAGDTCVELFDQWHWGKNNGTTETQIVVFYIGNEETPLSIMKDAE